MMYVETIDLHLKGFRAMGARIEFEQGYVRAHGPLHGEEIFLAGPFGPTVLGTANVMMAAVLTGRDKLFVAAMTRDFVPILSDAAKTWLNAPERSWHKPRGGRGEGVAAAGPFNLAA